VLNHNGLLKVEVSKVRLSSRMLYQLTPTLVEFINRLWRYETEQKALQKPLLTQSLVPKNLGNNDRLIYMQNSTCKS
jgi:hypothetical protein